MKQIAIRKKYSYFFTDSDEITSGKLDDKLEHLDQEMKTLLSKYGLQSTGGYTIFLGLDKYSIDRCEICDCLMVNRDKNPFGFIDNYMINDVDNDIDNVICNGGISQEKILCEECLPTTHRWGLHS